MSQGASQQRLLYSRIVRIVIMKSVTTSCKSGSWVACQGCLCLPRMGLRTIKADCRTRQYSGRWARSGLHQQMTRATEVLEMRILRQVGGVGWSVFAGLGKRQILLGSRSLLGCMKLPTETVEVEQEVEQVILWPKGWVYRNILYHCSHSALNTG